MAVVLNKKPALKIESTERQFKNSVDAFCLKHNDVIPLEFDINILIACNVAFATC